MKKFIYVVFTVLCIAPLLFFYLPSCDKAPSEYDMGYDAGRNDGFSEGITYGYDELEYYISDMLEDRCFEQDCKLYNDMYSQAMEYAEMYDEYIVGYLEEMHICCRHFMELINALDDLDY